MKKQNHDLLERVHHLQNEVTDVDMRRHELENQLRNANTVNIEWNLFVLKISFRSAVGSTSRK